MPAAPANLADGSRAREWLVVKTVAPWIIAAVAAVVLVEASNAFLLLMIGTIVIYSISAIGLTWLMGRAGLVSIGNAAIMGVGAYITAIASAKPVISDFPIPILLSAVGGMVAGLIVGLPGLRIRGIYLAISTLALQYFVTFAGSEYEQLSGQPSGLVVTPLSIAGHTFLYGRGLVLILLAFLGLTVLLVRSVLRQGPGRMFGAIKESEIAAAAIGVNTTRWKLAAFVGSSAVIAVAGSLFAYYTEVVDSATFSLDFAITFIVIIIIGGMGSIPGAIVGAVIVVGLPHLLTMVTSSLPQAGIGQWLQSNVFYINEGLFGFLLLLVIIYQPDGLAAATQAWPGLRHLPPRLKRHRPTAGSRREPTVAPVTKCAAPAITAMPRPDQPESGDHRVQLAQIEGLAVTYRGGARAVDGLNMTIDRGAIVALLGRNGAGKTSTLRAISGFLPAERVRLEGSIRVAGHQLLGMTPVTASKWAMLVPETDKIFPSLTVEEHLRIRPGRPDADVQEQPFFAPLRNRWHQRAGLLSGGERQLLALAMAWQQRPRLLLVDEFSLGLAPVAIQRVAEVIRALRDDYGMSCLVVEQNVAAALQVADWVYLMEAGRITAEGPPDTVAAEALVGQSLLLQPEGGEP